VTSYRVNVDLDLASTGDGGLTAPLNRGNRSLLFVFPALGEDDEPVRFGAFVEHVDDGEPGRRCAAQLLFWDDLAEVYASPGATFDVWYSRIVGRGVVRSIVSDS
jgi:hypothetical protein